MSQTPPASRTLLYAPGARVRITQQIGKTTGGYAMAVEGKVLRHERQGSGSWFAGNRHNKVWLDRLIIQKNDGEISVLNLDAYSRIELLAGPAPTEALPPMALPNEDPVSGVT